MSTSRSSPTALRPLSTALGCLERADGSSTFGFGPLSVAASVSGPTEVRIRDELTDRATLEVLFQPLSGSAGIPSKTVSVTLHTLFSSVLLLHHHPRSMIQLVLQTLSSPPPPTTSTASRSKRRGPPLLIGPDVPPSPSEKACMINAASLALLDAGIVAKGTVAACACTILREDEGTLLRQAGEQGFTEAQIRNGVRLRRIERGLPEEEDDEETGNTIVLLDPTPTELSYALSTHVFAFSFFGQRQGEEGVESEQVFAESLGGVEIQDHQRAMSLCRDAAQAVLGVMRQSVERRVSSQIP